MNGGRVEQRYREWIVAALYLVGFLTPWEWLLPGLKGLRVWSWLAYQIFHAGWMTSQAAFIALAAAAIAAAFAGAALAVYGSFVDRPVPSALGEWLTGAAVSLLMPHGGALVFLLALALLEVRVTMRPGKAGQAGAGRGRIYAGEYVAEDGRSPDVRGAAGLFRSVLRHSYSIGIAVCFAGWAWNYDATLLVRCVLICFGGSLVMRALIASPVR